MVDFWKLTAMRFTELLLATEQVPLPIRVKSRRRPGRNNRVSPHLVPLLRNPATVNIPPPTGVLDLSFPADDFALLRHIGFGLLLSVPLWAIVVAIVWMVLGWIN